MSTHTMIRAHIARVARASMVAGAILMTSSNSRGDDATPFTGSIATPESGSAAGAGALASAEVDPTTGVLRGSYRFDLETPRGNVQVGLGLDYSSAAGVGFAGYGWDVNVPQIHRVHPSGNVGAPTYSTPGDNIQPWDRFSYGNAPLVPICIVGQGACPLLKGENLPSWATANWVYFRPEVEGMFARFFLSPNRRTWIIEQQNGETLQLGAPLDNLADTSGIDFDGKQIYQWNIVRRLDERGALNRVTYVWAQLGARGVGFLTDIYDTPADAAGDASGAAHRTHLDYEAPANLPHNFAPRWATVPDLRLKTVTVTSARFTSTARELVRRYHLTYLEGDYTNFGYYSLLSSVQLEGECSGSTDEGVALANPGPWCTTMPATTFDYGPPLQPAVSALLGTGPKPSDQPLLIDFNSDGLPDLVTPSTSPNTPQNLYLNSAIGGLLTVARVDLALDPSNLGGATPQSFLTYNPSQTEWANIGNWLGDGNIDVLWANGQNCATFSGSLLGAGTSTPTAFWSGAVAPCYAVNPASIPGGGGDLKTIGDLNADGLTDQIDCPIAQNVACTSTFTRRAANGYIYPYGGASNSHGPLGASNGNYLIGVPNQGCIDGETASASVVDMNGDGIGDLAVVDATYGEGDCTAGPGFSFLLLVYLGHGDGTFELAYTPGGIPTPTTSATPPRFLLHDVNGDGFADFLVNTTAGVTVAFGEPGPNNTTQFSAADTSFTRDPIQNGWDPNVCLLRAADMDGSGSDDIVVICPGYGNVSSKSFDSARPSRTLQTISNGLGATTHIGYTTTTQLMVDARASAPWASTTPQPMHVVTTLQSRNHLPGAKEEVHGTYYRYANPIYDGAQQRFRGFRQVTTQPFEDNPAIPSAGATGVQTTYLVGMCDVDAHESCGETVGTIDRPFEALRGLPTLTETFSTSTALPSTNVPAVPGAYASSRAMSYRLRRLYAGLDGRFVRFAAVEQSDSFRYDTSLFISAPQATVLLQPIDAVDDVGLSKTTLFQPPASYARVQTKRAFNDFGGVTDTWNNGQVNAQPPDAPVHNGRMWQGFGPDGWWSRPITASVDGGSATPGTRLMFVEYDSYGHPQSLYGILSGTLALDRHHETAGAPVAGAPWQASHDGAVLLGAFTYDAFGNLTHTAQPDGACVDVEYDPLYNQLATSTTTYAGAAGGSGGCGSTALTLSSVFDRGLEVVTLGTAPTGAVTLVEYDGFGRPRHVDRPSTTFHETTTIDYTDVDGGPVQMQHVGVSASDDGTVVRNMWTFTDGFGRAVLSFSQADRYAGDQGDWTVSGLPDRDGLGLVRHAYRPGWSGGVPSSYPLGQSPSAWITTTTYDAFARVVAEYETDGTQASRSVYHALSVDQFDARQISLGLSPTTYTRDGHGRLVRELRLDKPNSMLVQFAYDAPGDLTSVTQEHYGTSDPPVVRWMQYDTLGRLVLNAEPNTSLNFVATSSNAAGMKAWRYAYDDAGRLVGTSDARGCGENIYYDAGGRRVAEDYSPCRAAQANYTAPKIGNGGLPTGDGTEAFRAYDAPELGESSDFGGNPNYLLGALVASSDRSTHTRFAYDVRGRVTGVARQLASPTPPGGQQAYSLSGRYTPTWYRSATAYDDMDRPIATSTGADAHELMGSDGASTLTAVYSARGVVAQVAGSYGVLLQSQTFDSDGFLLGQEFGDVAGTSGSFTPNGRRLVERATFARQAPALWTQPNNQGYAPPPVATETLQTDLADWEFLYGPTDEPTTIVDNRKGYEWPPGAQPVSRTMAYDDFGRLKGVTYTYPTATGTDRFVSPLQAEEASGDTNVIPFASPPMSTRVLQQTFTYDWLGNTKSSTDDSNLFWDRGIGTITNGTAQAGPNRLVSAVGTANGSVNATYDGAGNLENLAVVRGACTGRNACAYRFVYDWDEVGHVARARRWDFTVAHAPTTPPPAAGADAFTPPYPGLPPQRAAVDLTYSYDEGGWRVLKMTTAEDLSQTVSAQIFSTLRLDGASYDEATGDYEHTATTESVYLAGGGVSARLLYAPSGVPSVGRALHVLLEIGDHLASTSVVVDKDTSELVERVTYQAYGQSESDYRPTRWASYREKYRFTGMEDDLEVGLTYFGQRYYSAPLGRWISADPLAIHALGADANPYRYVGNSPFAHVDLFGLDDDAPPPEDPAGGGDSSEPVVDGIKDETDALFGDDATKVGSGHDGASIDLTTGGSGAASSGPSSTGDAGTATPAGPPGFMCPGGLCGQFGDGRAMTPEEYGDEREFYQIVADLAADLADRWEQNEAKIEAIRAADPNASHRSDFGGNPVVGLETGIVNGGADVIDWFVNGPQRVPEPVPGPDEGLGRGTGAGVMMVVTIAGSVFARHPLRVNAAPRAYEVAFEANLTKQGVGTYPSHFAEANEQLLKAMADPEIANALKATLGADFEGSIVSSSGGVRGVSPSGWTWHHVPDQPGVLQLVPGAQHAPGSAWQGLLHPGGVGGMSIWGADY